MIEKRIFSLALALGLLLTVVGPAFATPSTVAASSQQSGLAKRTFVHHDNRFVQTALSLRASAAAHAEKTCAVSGSVTCSTYAYSGVHWNSGSRVLYFIDMNYSTKKSPTLTHGAAMTAVYGSFRVWRAAMPATGGITYVYGGTTKVTPDKQDGRNVIGWGPLPTGTLALTSVWYRPSTGQIVEADITLNSNNAWAYTPPTGCTITTITCNPAPAGPTGAYDLRNVVTHEAGHTLMLDDLYGWSNRGLTMYGYGNSRQRAKESLGTGDRLGVRAIY